MENALNRVEFEAKLNKVYGGTVKVSTSSRYVNEGATLRFNCSKCSVSFFGKPSYMVGTVSQRHQCNKPYGTVSGVRFGNVSATKKTKYKGNTKETIQQLEQLLELDVQPKSIASKLGLNCHLVLDYIQGKFEREVLQNELAETKDHTGKAL